MVTSIHRGNRAEIIERQLHSNSVKSPQDLLITLKAFCKAKDFEMESLEMRNDVYIIRLKRPVFQQTFFPEVRNWRNMSFEKIWY